MVFFLGISFRLRHVSVGLSFKNLGGHVPDEDGTFRTTGHDELLVWRDSDLRDGSRMTSALEVLNSFIVVPDLNDLVFAS